MRKRICIVMSILVAILLSGCTVEYDDINDSAKDLYEKIYIYTPKDISLVKNVEGDAAEIVKSCFESIEICGATFTIPMNISDIPEEFEMYKDFQNTFGFRQYDYPNKYQDTIFVNLEGNQALMIQGYDFITTTYISDEERNKEIQDVKLSYLDIEYTISSKLKNEIIYINLLDKNNIVLIEFSLKEIIDRYSTGYSSENLLTLEDATFITENEKVRMGIIVQDFYFDKLANINTYWGTVNILIDFK